MRGTNWNIEDVVFGGKYCIAICDFIYVFMMIYQRYYYKSFPSLKYRSNLLHSLNIVLHIVFGSIIIFMGTALFFIYEYYNANFYKINESFSYVMIVAGCIHSITSIILSPKCSGERLITFPLYIGSIFINMTNVYYLAKNIGDYTSLMNLWGSVNIFIFVRIIYVIYAWTGIDRDLLYTYSLGVSGFWALLLTAQDPLFFVWNALVLVFCVFYFAFKCSFLHPRKKPATAIIDYLQQPIKLPFDTSEIASELATKIQFLSKNENNKAELNDFILKFLNEKIESSMITLKSGLQNDGDAPLQSIHVALNKIHPISK